MIVDATDFNGEFPTDGGGATRPLLLSEYSTTIVNLHQLQLMGLNNGQGNFLLIGNVDASSANGANAAGIWSPTGFVPVSATGAPTLNGLGNTISGLFENYPTTGTSASAAGLFGALSGGGVIENLNMTGANVTGAYAGSIVGVSGVVSPGTGMAVGATPPNDNVSGSVSGVVVGGIVGQSYGVEQNDSSSGSVSGGGDAGGIVGEGSGAEQNDHSSANVSGGYAGGIAGYGAGFGETIENSLAERQRLGERCRGHRGMGRLQTSPTGPPLPR